jgi:serine/threonine protein kinase
MALAAGHLVGPYRILGLLGAGGMGAVYRARDTRLERDVALKFLHGSSEAALRARLLREARAASALKHPNICAVYDIGESAGDAYIAMELVDGRPVDADVPAGGMGAATVVRLAIELTDALEHAHGRGIIHRDLKGANILRDLDGRVKVLDFGLARRLPQQVIEEATRSAHSVEGAGMLAGTLAWMAPEVLRGEPADARSDLWAVGVLMYELATSALPFAGASAFDLASHILNDPPPRMPPGTPPALSTVVSKLLEKDPAARYQSAAEVRAALEVAREELERRDDAEADSPVPRNRSWRRVAWTVLAAATVALVAVAAWLSWSARPLALQDQTIVSDSAVSQASPSISPDGRLVAYVSPDGNDVPQIWIQPLPRGEPVRITSGEAAAFRPRWSPTGDIVFARSRQGIWAVSYLGGTPRRLLESGLNPNLSIDGKQLVYEREQGIWTAAADGAGARRLDHIPVKYYSIPSTPAFSPDARFVVYFSPEAGPNGDFWIAPMDGSQPPRRLTNDLREGGYPVWTADGRIIFSSARGGSRTLWQVPAAGGEPEPLTTGAGEDDEPDLARDGQRLVYSNVRRRWTLVIGNAEGGEDRELLERRTEIVFPQFSPDGRSIAFFGRNDRAVDIFTIGSDGTDLRALTGGIELNHMPRWSHDGTWVYFFQTRPELSFRRVPALGGASEFALPLVWETHNFPQFDPTGRQLSYTRLQPPGDNVTMIRELESGAERPLPGPAIFSARWSRDGRHLVGWRVDRTVAICPVAAGPCRALTPGSLPAWSGDGSRIYFIKGSAGADDQFELWSVDLDGTNLRHVRRVGPFRGLIDTFFDVSRDDRIVWGKHDAGRRELWSATVR